MNYSELYQNLAWFLNKQNGETAKRGGVKGVVDGTAGLDECPSCRAKGGHVLVTRTAVTIAGVGRVTHLEMHSLVHDGDLMSADKKIALLNLAWPKTVLDSPHSSD